MSKEVILNEIRPKHIFFIGKVYNYSKEMKKRLESKQIKVKFIKSTVGDALSDLNQIFNVKVDSNLFQNLNSVFIKDYGYLYELQNKILKVKRTRINSNTVSEVCIISL